MANVATKEEGLVVVDDDGENDDERACAEVSIGPVNL